MGNIEGQIDRNQSVLKNSFMWKKQASLGYCDLVKDTVSGIMGESYTCYIEQYANELNIYQFRKMNPRFIVTVYSVQQMSSQFLCAAQQTLRVVTERIPYRLPDLGHIGFHEGLYIIECCLKGARIISKNHGTFQLDQNMICFNTKGEAKIWINQNFSLNIPQIHGNFSQKQLIDRIMEIVEDRMSGNKLRQYKSKKKQHHLNTFQMALGFITENRREGQKVDNVTLPSMVAQSLSTPSNIEIKVKNELGDSLRTTKQMQRKLPKGLPPRPPKSRSKSKSNNTSSKEKNANTKSQPKPKIVKQNNNKVQELKRNRFLSPQMDKKVILNNSPSVHEQKYTTQAEEGKFVIRFSNNTVQKPRVVIFNKESKETQQKQKKQQKQPQKPKQKPKQAIKFTPIQEMKVPEISKQKKMTMNNYFSPNYQSEKETKKLIKNLKVTEPLKKLAEKKQANQAKSSNVKINFTFNPKASQ